MSDLVVSISAALTTYVPAPRCLLAAHTWSCIHSLYHELYPPLYPACPVPASHRWRQLRSRPRPHHLYMRPDREPLSWQRDVWAPSLATRCHLPAHLLQRGVPDHLAWTRYQEG